MPRAPWSSAPALDTTATHTCWRTPPSTALAAIFIALPFLPTDVEGEETTAAGRLHLLAAVAWFALAYTCMGNSVDLLEPITPDLVGSSLDVLSKIALVSLIALVAALLIRPARRYAFAIAERVFLVAVNVFYVLVTVGILAR